MWRVPAVGKGPVPGGQQEGRGPRLRKGPEL